MNNIHKLRILVIVLTGLLTACATPTPIPIFVTPTPNAAAQPVTGATAVAPPTVALAVPEIQAAATAEPTGVTPTLVSPTEVAALPTATMTATASPTLPPPPPTNTEVPPPTSTQLPAPTAVVPSGPTPTGIGSIIGPDYTPPATATVPPTGTSAALSTPEATTPPTGEQQAPPAGVTNVPTLNRERMGIQLDINLTTEDWNEALRRVQDDLSLRWIKVQISWRDMQPNGPDENTAEYFRRVEQHLEEANRRGLNVLVSVVKAPLWARTVQQEDGPPDDPQALASFITFMLNEINAGLARPTVGEYIDAIEIWNEPNLQREWQGTLPFSGAGYMGLFEPAYQAVRAYSATMPIITAGLAPTGRNPGTVDDREFLRQMYAAGLGQYRDVSIGVHPYGWGNAPDATCCGDRGWDDDPHFFFGDTMREYRAIMRDNGHGETQMWVTEFGWAVWEGFPGDPPAGSEWMRFNDKWAQGNYTLRAFEIGQADPLVGPMFLWNLNFATLDGLIENRDERIAYSIVVPGSLGQLIYDSEGLTERPLYWMLYDAVRPDVQLDRYD